MRKSILLTSLLIFCLKVTNSQPGSLDYSFAKKGVVTADLGVNVGYSSKAKQVFAQSDGSMFVVFESQGAVLISKKRVDGSPDSSYGRFGYSVSVFLND